MNTFKKLFLTGLIICNISLTSCNQKEKNATVTVDTVETDFFQSLDSSPITITFEGILPCKGCDGILTTIQLIPDSSSFSISEVYKNSNQPDSTIRMFGTYREIAGKDSIQMEYELTLSNSNEVLFYYLENDSVLTKLDPSHHIFPGNIKHSLKKVRDH